MSGMFLNFMNTLKKVTVLSALVALPNLAFAQSKNVSEKSAAHQEKAVFAGGCFWSMESAFGKVAGISKLVVGFAGGNKKNPSYEAVSAGDTGHLESIEITFDPQKTSFQKLLDVYWHNIEPTNGKGQFVDEGEEYHPAIFYNSPEQKKAAEESKIALAKSGKFGDKPIAVKILPAAPFYPAEEYHQQYYIKNAEHYQRYRRGSGRDAYFEKVWGSAHP